MGNTECMLTQQVHQRDRHKIPGASVRFLPGPSRYRNGSARCRSRLFRKGEICSRNLPPGYGKPVTILKDPDGRSKTGECKPYFTGLQAPKGFHSFLLIIIVNDTLWKRNDSWLTLSSDFHLIRKYWENVFLRKKTSICLRWSCEDAYGSLSDM